MAIQEHSRGLTGTIMRRRIWLVALVLYASVGLADGTHRLIEAPSSGSHAGFAANLAVAFCAGLFWPIDMVSRPLLM